MVRDCVPYFKTRYIDSEMHESYVRYPRNLLELEMRTVMFELACTAIEIDPSHVRRYLRKVQSLTISDHNREWHLRQYSKGGSSAVVVFGSSGGTQ
jgi:methylphosphotriester-DNA--protein-cysteine methyltransferase